MGGGDLNMKKSWHPLLIKNQERVWKEEQKALEEQKKLTQLMKEKEEERQLQELRKLQESAGGRKGPERLDWMYAAGPNQSSSAKAQELEDFLLGKKSVGKLIDNSTALSKLSESNDVFTSAMNPNANSYRDTQSKIREDPLLLIKKTEQANIKAIFTNPIKMKELKEKSKKSKKDKSKKHDSDSKSSSKKHHKKYSDDDSDSYHNHDKYSRSKKRYRSRSRSPSPSKKRYRSRSRSPSPSKKRYRSYSRSPSPSKRRYRSHSRSPSPSWRRDRRNSPMRRDYHERNDRRRNRFDDNNYNRFDENRVNDDNVRKQKLQQMMDDAKKLKEDRKKRVDDINREEKEEELKVAEHKKRTFESGSYSEYLKNAYKDAYSSSSSFDLGERVRRHRGTLQKAGE
ncbi:Pre-mRNA splicing factor-domain-containing protein [Gigaspora rosea]|uniref:Pre-mRNA splicing factor-domain-containing protein n=1 Tax=Gigaspora rosea TaxID=44941 RepID=A0A397UJZ3_9GLOM|nr:Pre-mRNA splicing factor-domain-containing protein [Gigaspora rosea]